MKLSYRLIVCLLLVSGITFAATKPTTSKPKSKASKAAKPNIEKEQSAASPGSEHENLPPALSKHLEKLHRAMPGNGGLGAAGTPAAEAFLFMAYPDTDIALARFDTERAAMRSLKGGRFPKAKDGRALG